jgi:hypothetical protein
VGGDARWWVAMLGGGALLCQSFFFAMGAGEISASLSGPDAVSLSSDTIPS